MTKQEALLSISGHEYDKDLARVPIKVSPALQAIVANQLDLMDKVGKFCPEDAIYLEQLKLEMVQLEEEISSAFTRYMQRKEEQRLKRELKKVQAEAAPIPSMEELAAQFMEPSEPMASPFGGTSTANADLPPFDMDDSPVPGGRSTAYEAPPDSYDFNQGSIDQERNLDQMAAQLSPGLPSQKYETRSPLPEKQPEIDVKRVAIGASIKALEAFLGRKLSEEEMTALEQQVESYLG